MFRFLPSGVGWRAACRVLLAMYMATGAPFAAQSTFGTIRGTVRDGSGALVTDAQLTLLNAFRNIGVGA